MDTIFCDTSVISKEINVPFEKIVLRPGVNTQQTVLLNEASWSVSNLIRFFQGLLQKIGGWARIVSTPLIGTCRGILAWADLTGNVYVAAGTEQRLEVVSAGILYDITPIRKTTNPAPVLGFTLGSNLVQVTDASHGASSGDWINLLTPIQDASQSFSIPAGFYQISSIVDVNNYLISTPFTATSTSSGGNATPQFFTTNGSAIVTVLIVPDLGGFATGSVFNCNVSTAVGGLTIFGPYIVTISGGNITITAISGATSTANAFENGNMARIQYLLPTGLVSAGIAQGFGDGGFGLGPYSIGGASSTPAPLRQWSLGAWGEQLIASPSYGALYFWDPTSGTFLNPAAIITNAPAQQTGFFIAMPEQQIVSYGATDPSTGNIDPMLIRWCDVADYNDWTATAVNQAGSFRLPRGSKIVGGLQGPQYGLLWTDLGLWAQQYVQPPLIYGFTEISEGCGLISMRSVGILGTDIVWASQNGFFLYSTSTVQPLACDVWDVVFGNLTQTQFDKMLIGPNTHFNEFFLFYPSLTGNGENDSYVKCTKINGGWQLWDYGSLIRTAWTDQSVFGGPLGVDGNSLIQQHEQGTDADGSPLISSATSGWFKLNDGQLFVFIERMIPDFVLTGGATLQITVYTADYPEDTPTAHGPFNVTNTTEYIIIRSRSRLARIQISGTGDIGTFWRLGEMLYMATPSGRR